MRPPPPTSTLKTCSEMVFFIWLESHRGHSPSFPFFLAVNGYMYGSQPGLSMCKKDRVSWHLIGMGTDTDMHGVYFQGNTIHLRGTHRDSLALFPHMATTAYMQPDHSGKPARAITGAQIPTWPHKIIIQEKLVCLGTAETLETDIVLIRIRFLAISVQI